MLNKSLQRDTFEHLQHFAKSLLQDFSDQELAQKLCIFVPSQQVIKQIKHKMLHEESVAIIPKIISYSSLPDHLIHLHELAPQMPMILPPELDTCNYEMILEDLLQQMRTLFPHNKSLYELQVKGHIANFLHEYYLHNLITPRLEEDYQLFIKKLIIIFEANCASINKLHPISRRNKAVQMFQQHLIANPQREKIYYLLPYSDSAAYIKAFFQVMQNYANTITFKFSASIGKYQLIEAENIIDEASQVALAIVHEIQAGKESIGIVCEDELLQNAVTAQLTAQEVMHTKVVYVNQLPGVAVFLNIIELISQINCNQWQLLLLMQSALPQVMQFELQHLRNAHEIKTINDLLSIAQKDSKFSHITTFAAELLQFSQQMSASLTIHQRIQLHRGFCERNLPHIMVSHLKSLCNELEHSFKVHSVVDLKSYAKILTNIFKQRVSHAPEASYVEFLKLADIPLMQFEALFIMGANEGTIPNTGRRWMALSQELYTYLGFITPQQATSVDAKYLAQGLSIAPYIVISRAKIRDGKPAKISRLIPQLIPSQQLHKVSFGIVSINHEPTENILAKVDIDNRPRSFSASAIEYLINNPYLYYVRYILRLLPLKAIGANIIQQSFGIAVHAAIKQLIAETKIIDKMQFIEQFSNYILQFAPNTSLDLKLWKHRAIQIAAWLFDYELSLTFREHFQEHKMATIISVQDLELTLYAIFDRVIFTNDDILIIDYKTGLPPSQADVNKGLSPQLAVENLIINHLYPKEDVKQCYISLQGKKETARISNIFCADDITELHLYKLLKMFVYDKMEYFATNSEKYYEYNHILRR